MPCDIECVAKVAASTVVIINKVERCTLYYVYDYDTPSDRVTIDGPYIVAVIFDDAKQVPWFFSKVAVKDIDRTAIRDTLDLFDLSDDDMQKLQRFIMLLNGDSTKDIKYMSMVSCIKFSNMPDDAACVRSEEIMKAKDIFDILKNIRKF
ncbi:hypothetical protein HYH03_017290 [Edaphochlamys debaryana]|uniref:Uncharacterized protein n=1 Tax=Edaphochlamys debaryana TaxID=47281 RepID=A0A836BP30_9CHLO|nr:hypothetical protein HYH03_017290 [Edaphochlamys debaryana]|eukprot:KAG2483896.1 hypothetical protein HYH03_017290 [Edaphochlamys debaryana]